MTTKKLTLITGFPRLLSRLVARELAARGEAVTLLTRTRDLGDAQRFVSELQGNATVTEGDITSIDMGLSGAEYFDLARRVQCIHHAAQTTHEGVDARSARTLHRHGTHEVIEFARVGRELGTAPRVVAYSSIVVAGDYDGTMREADLELGQRFRSEVERTLYDAERALRRAWNELPITVLRPSVMVGHSETGEIDVLDGPYLFMLLALVSPVDVSRALPNRGEGPLHVVPVDHVARAGVCLGASPQAISRCFHLIDPRPLTVRRALELIARSAGRVSPRGFLSAVAARGVLHAQGVERLVRSPRAFFEHLSTHARYECDGAHTLLSAAGVTCPSFESYVDVLVEHVRQRIAHRAEVDVPATDIDAVTDPLA